MNLIVDLVAGLLFVGLLATGYVLEFALPPGTNKDLILWGWARHDWGQVHAWISGGFLATLGLHLALHWQWCVSAVETKLSWLCLPGLSPAANVGVAAAIVVVAVCAFGWIAEQNVQFIPSSCQDSSEGAPAAEPARLAPAEAAAAGLPERVRDYLAANCLECHGPTRPAAGIRVDRRDDLVAAMPGATPWVVPGKSAESALVELLSGARTTPKQPRAHHIPAEDVELLRQWIDTGAVWP